MEAANVKKLEEGYPKYCGTKCQHEAPSFYEAIKSSMKDKYGVENAFQLDSVKKDLACRQTEIQARRD